jgi:hypothetical protein
MIILTILSLMTIVIMIIGGGRVTRMLAMLTKYHLLGLFLCYRMVLYLILYLLY